MTTCVFICMTRWSKKDTRNLLQIEVTKIERLSDGAPQVALRRDPVGKDTQEVFDAVLYATGRVPSTQGLGLLEAGVALDESGGGQGR